MGYTVIAPVGDNLKALFVGIKEFPTERVILITPPQNLISAKKLAKKLDEFTIKTEIVKMNGGMMEEMFRIFGSINNKHGEDNLLVNVATGDRMTTCAALSASFANGLKAFGIVGDKVMIMPIMKLSYYNELSDNKLRILKELSVSEYFSLSQLSKKLEMSISLLSYHIRGNPKHKGLEEFRLVKVKEDRKYLYVKLSEMGNLLLKGYIKPNA